MSKNDYDYPTHRPLQPLSDQANVDPIPSPVSTGGAGAFFEQHVTAYWLTQLLVQGIPPILHDCAVVEVHLQTNHLGWHTDDFLIVGQNSSANRRKLAGQVKRKFTVSATDGECQKAVQDFWKDFRNTQQFSTTDDRLVLVTLRGTNTLLEHFSGLLDCSRAARDVVEFKHRLETPGLINAKSVKYYREIQKIISDAEERNVSIDDVWPFLRVLHLLSLDLGTETRQMEAMIKTLLAYTTSEQDAISAAETSWNNLLREAGEGLPEARSYRYHNLPEALRLRHAPLAAGEHRALRALSDHSTVILSGIRSTIGSDLHLERARLVQQIIEQLESTQIVLISGVAGAGKSAVAKDATDILAADHFVFSFRAEEFAHPHFDETLHSSQIPANAAMLGAILACQDQKVLLVESVERLLEKPIRDAFTDLLALAAKDKSWRLVFTCRDYSTDLVRAYFLEVTSVDHSVVMVPPLDDGELGAVEVAHPTLARPLRNVALRQLLRNPYVLDKALQIQWSNEQPLPKNEREFRNLFWRLIIRADQHAASGMPRRRNDAFLEIALQRARALSQYANCSTLDPAVVHSLRSDSLIVSSQDGDIFVAPAHDVLEDWAILRWIEEQYVTHRDSIQEFSSVIGSYPAIRRTYRKWVSELVEQDPEAANALLQATVSDGGRVAQFYDDTLVSLLRSPASARFLERHRFELFANDKQLLRRMIHLLRVACVTTPSWVEASAAHALLFNVPDGVAWVHVLRLVQTHLQSFTKDDHSLLLGFIEDWARGVSWQTPYPEGAESVAVIAHWLLLDYGNYRSSDQRTRTLQVIAKVPNADNERFAALLQESSDGGERNRTVAHFREIIFEGLAGMPAARDVPEVIISAAKDYLLCSEADLRREWAGGNDPELDTLFGIKRYRGQAFFPASAYRGLFLPLLRYHFREGLAFIIDVFNHSADWYAHPRVRSEYVEPPYEITLTFTDEISRTQWCNPRLWNLYRGTSVGPYVLQSLLMALELRLLEVAEEYPHQLDTVLLRILKRSDSAAITAVVASIATAFPHMSGETLLVLLRSPLCILLDRHRLVNEQQARSKLSAVMPSWNARDKVFEEERKEADARPHRRHDLEMAIVSLQLGPLAPRVHEILDRHRSELPLVEEQDEDDHIWRLAMHRMDLRQYNVTEEVVEVPVKTDDDASTEVNRTYIRLDLNDPDPDVKEMVDLSASRLQSMNLKRGLLWWGVNVFRGEETTTYDPAEWRHMLQKARTASISDSDGEEHGMSQSGPGYVAAVCIRDHWEEISDAERQWSVDVVCSEVEREGDRWNRDVRLQRFPMSADRGCAFVLPLLAGKSLDDKQVSRVYQALVIALTHAIYEVRDYAAWGIGRYLWAIDRDLTLRCVNALATEAIMIQRAVNMTRSRPNREHHGLDVIEAKVASVIRRRFFETGTIEDDAYQTMDIATWYGAKASIQVLAILRQAPAESVAITTFERLTQTLVEWWDSDDDRRNPDQARPVRNFEIEATLTDLIVHFLLHTTTTDALRIINNVVNAINTHPDKVHDLLIGLILVEDRQPNTGQFWALWERLADGVRQATWGVKVDDYQRGGKMISAIFLSTWWEEKVRHWRSLEGYAGLVHTLFQDLPASSAGFDAYLRFLYHIGEQSLPEAFGHMANRLQQGDPRQMLREANTVSLLEALLQRYVYGRPLELKRQSNLREAVLFLLDLLVEHGSSAAFRMRDDFVTPISQA